MIVGIDPGVKGAIALLDGSRLETIPLNIEMLYQLAGVQIETLIIEKLKPLPKDTPTTAWELAKTVGWVEALCAGYDPIWVTPETWQAWAWKGISHDIETKARTNIAFLNHFPDCTTTPAYARAACLMAKYGSLRLG